MKFPTLETERLRIRDFVMTDLDALHPMLNAALGELALAERKKWLEWTIAGYEQYAKLYQPPYGERAVVLKASDTLIGTIGIVPSFGPFETLAFFQERLAAPPTGHSVPMMGLYWLTDAPHRGHGYASESARAVTDQLFKMLNLHFIVATTEDDNALSIRVMRRLGMTIEHNPNPVPEWFQVVGILENPAAPNYSA